MDRLSFDESEILLAPDVTDIGRYALAGTDRVTVGALGWPAHWSRLTVATKPGAPTVVIVSAGEMHDVGAIYANGTPIETDLQVYKPIAASDETWVALVLRPRTDEITLNRAIETGEEPLQESVPVVMPVAKRFSRVFGITVQQGMASPAPARRPVIAATDCCVAFVRLTTSGVAEIVANEPARVKTVYEIETRTVALEVQMVKVIQDTTTIATDLAALGGDVLELARRVPPRELVEQFSRDISRHNQILNVPEEARNYWFDQALVKDRWDFAHAAARFRINEGIRFQYQNERDAQIRLLNPDSADIKRSGNLVLPAWSEVTRVANLTGSGTKDISNTVHTVVTATQLQRPVTKVSYGPTITVCENMAGWGSAGLPARRPQEVFAANGRTFQYAGYQGAQSFDAHQVHAVREVITQTTQESYTVYNTETFGLNGAIHGQTFLSSQVMIATSIEVFCKRVGSTGDVLLVLCLLNEAGAPDFNSVIARVNKPRGELVANAWNKIDIPPTLLDQGERYAWFTVTTGNHAFGTSDANAFSGGSAFVCTDGVWSQLSTTEDFLFKVNGARFAASRVTVPLESAILEGGMTELTLLFDNLLPAGTKIAFEVKSEGRDEWVPIDPREANALTNLPALVQIRAVLIGTADIAPGIVIDQWARVRTGRMRNDLQAIGKELTFGFSSSQAQIVVNMDAYDSVHHTCTPKIILADGTVVSPASITPVVDREKPSRTKFTANFNFGSPQTRARWRLDATTDTVVSVPFGQDIQLNAF